MTRWQQQQLNVQVVHIPDRMLLPLAAGWLTGSCVCCCGCTLCSLFNPTPSLSACIMNHFKMGSKTINYNLGGMGCSASLVAIDLAKQVCGV